MSATDVGRRIHVYWTDETAWFTGTVQAFDPAQGLYVLYDDGDERWEGVNESYRFEGDGEATDEEGDAEERDSEEHGQYAGVSAASAVRPVQTPRATEPPASEEDEADEEEDDELPSTSGRGEVGPVYPRPIVFNKSANGEDGGGELHQEEEEEEEDAQSVALTDIPTTFEPAIHQPPRDFRPQRHRRMVPHRGMLRGVVTRASDLPLVNDRETPRAYVRVAFAEGATTEAGAKAVGSLLLRCKQTLASTQPASASRDPVWNDDSDVDGDGVFQLQVAPPCVITRGVSTPAWHQLRGELIFSVYHQSENDSRGGDFIGQATAPLARILSALLDREDDSRAVITPLPLVSRQGRPVGLPTTQIIVQYQCELEYPLEQRRPRATPESTGPLIHPSSSSTTKPTPRSASSSSSKPAIATHNRPPTRVAAATSSSEINRRKMAQQIERENKAMAKRLEATHKPTGASAHRRQQLLIHATSEPKAPPPRNHRASSQVNRAKFIDQVKKENAAMGKRLLGRPANSSSKDTLDWDDAKAQDKAYVADKRRALRREKDYLMEKAQAACQQQSELVQDVMALQQQVAEAKAAVSMATTQLQRLDAMNKRDAHVRDCLQRAASKSQRGQNNGGGSSKNNYYSPSDEDDEEDDKTPATAGYRRELRTLREEAATLESEQQRLQDQLHAARQREEALEDEILSCHRTWQFVQSKRAFVAKIHAAPASHALKRHQLDLSPEEEEQYAIYHAQQELTQLQIALTVLKDKQQRAGLGSSSSTTTSSSKACEYLRSKIAKRQQQIEQRERQQTEWRAKYEALVVDATYEQLRGRVQELQHVVFLCESEAKHVAAAERAAIHRQQQTASTLQRQRFHEQSESDVLFKKA